MAMVILHYLESGTIRTRIAVPSDSIAAVSEVIRDDGGNPPVKSVDPDRCGVVFKPDCGVPNVPNGPTIFEDSVDSVLVQF